MDCLDEGDLVAFASCLLGEAEVTRVLEHLGHCQLCSDAIAALAGDAGGCDASATSELAATDGGAAGAVASHGRYILTRLLGAGGMGVVYASYDTALERTVALKLLRLRDSDGDTVAMAAARLVNEARALARVAHPNVVRVYDAGLMNGRVFVAMELIDGVPLSAWLKEERRSWRAVCDIFVQTAQGLAAVHEAGLVHRDFKPQNVLVTRSGSAHVADFGLAAVVGAREVEGQAGAPQNEARVSGAPADLAEAWLIVGRCELETGRYDQAEQRLSQGAALAMTARDDETLARALLSLATLAGTVQRQSTQAQLFARLAEGALGRVGASPRLMGELADVRAQLAFYGGDPETAYRYVKDAIRLFEGTYGDSSPRVWWLLSLTAWALRDLGQLDEALVAAQKSLDLRLATLGPDHPDVAKGSYNLAQIYLERRQAPEAQALLERARAIAERSPGSDSLLTLRCRLGAAEAAGLLGRPDEGAREVREVISLMMRIAGHDNARVGEAHSVLGELELQARNAYAARVAFARSLDVLGHALGQTNPRLAEPLLGLAEAAIMESQPQEALASLQRAGELLGLVGGMAAFPAERERLHRDMARALVQSRRGCDATAAEIQRNSVPTGE